MTKKTIILVIVLIAILSFGCKKKPEAAKPETPVVTEDSVVIVAEDKTEDTESPTKGKVGEDSMEDWIKGYEKVVIAFEKKSADGKLSVKDMAAINQKMEELSDKQDEKNLTPSQMSRLTALALRMTKVMQKIKPF